MVPIVGAKYFSLINKINNNPILNANNHSPIDEMNIKMDNIPRNDEMNTDPIMRAKNSSPLRWQRGNITNGGFGDSAI